jgi:hypothetical protein
MPAPHAGVAAPSVGVVVLSLGDPGLLKGLLSGLVPACREFAADLVVVRRGPPLTLMDLDQAGVRVVFGSPADGEADLRARGTNELRSDVTIFTTDTEPLSRAWNELLARVGQTVQVRNDEVPPDGWVTVLRQAAVSEPGT